MRAEASGVGAPVAGFDDLDSFDDFSPGAQVPLSGSSGGLTGPTQALASAAYRDGKVADLVEINDAASFSSGKFSLFEPNLGEAFSRAVQVRMLGGGRKPLIQSFGVEPRTVAEHALAAGRLRRKRDAQLTTVTVLFSLLFLPGTLLWLIYFQVRQTLSRIRNKEAKAMTVAGVTAAVGRVVSLGAVVSALGTILLGLLAVLAIAVLLLAAQLPLAGLWLLYLVAQPVGPVLGYLVAKRICERSATQLRARWSELLGGTDVGAKIPEAVPQHPGDAGAEEIRLNLAKLAAEQQSNMAFYAGPKGILGMGTRWGSWDLAEELVPRDPGTDIDGFRSWDVVRGMHDQLQLLERGPLHSGGFPKPSIRHWIVSPIGEKAGEVSRPESGPEVEAYRIKNFEIQRICNEQQFGAGDRHYLGVQFVLWDGQLVLTYLITVTVLHHTLRIEVTGHALGPVHPLFFNKPSPKSKSVPKSFRFWETKTITLPLVETKEVVRLAVRAPFTWFPAVLDFLGGKLSLPEPFGLRHVWADKPWRHRFMADDARRAVTPVLRVVHQAAMKVLEEHGVDTTQFGARSQALSGQIQSADPRRADEYNA